MFSFTQTLLSLECQRSLKVAVNKFKVATLVHLSHEDRKKLDSLKNTQTKQQE